MQPSGVFFNTKLNRFLPQQSFYQRPTSRGVQGRSCSQTQIQAISPGDYSCPAGGIQIQSGKSVVHVCNNSTKPSDRVAQSRCGDQKKRQQQQQQQRVAGQPFGLGSQLAFASGGSFDTNSCGFSNILCENMYSDVVPGSFVSQLQWLLEGGCGGTGCGVPIRVCFQCNPPNGIGNGLFSPCTDDLSPSITKLGEQDQGNQTGATNTPSDFPVNVSQIFNPNASLSKGVFVDGGGLTLLVFYMQSDPSLLGAYTFSLVPLNHEMTECITVDGLQGANTGPNGFDTYNLGKFRLNIPSLYGEQCDCSWTPTSLPFLGRQGNSLDSVTVMVKPFNIIFSQGPSGCLFASLCTDTDPWSFTVNNLLSIVSRTPNF